MFCGIKNYRKMIGMQKEETENENHQQSWYSRNLICTIIYEIFPAFYRSSNLPINLKGKCFSSSSRNECEKCFVKKGAPRSLTSVYQDEYKCGSRENLHEHGKSRIKRIFSSEPLGKKWHILVRASFIEQQTIIINKKRKFFLILSDFFSLRFLLV